MEMNIDEGLAMTRLSIIVVSYNTREMTLACLDSILSETKLADAEVIVVDNASDDDSALAIEGHDLKLKLISLDSNIGFARANNLGAKQAQGEFILLLNPDTIVLDQAIDKLLSFAEQFPDAGIWGGKTLFGDGSLNPSSCWRKISPWTLLCGATGLAKIFPRNPVLNSEAYGGWERDSISEVDIVSGCFFLIRASLWKSLSGFDAMFFMYGEEADLCHRAKRLGVRPRITPDARIIHFGGASEQSRSGKLIKLLAAKMTLIRRHFHPLLKPVGMALLILWPLSRAIAFSAISLIAPLERMKFSRDQWRQVWRARSAWIKGYGGVGDGLSTPIVGHAAMIAENATSR